MRIGLLGGTFNPVHNGHIALARAAADEFKLDKVYFVPAYIPPHKEVAENVPAGDRLEMAKLAVKGEETFEISTYETDKEGTSYSIETIEYFKQGFGPDTEIFFLTGADSAKELHTWKEIDRILDLVTFVIAARPGWGEKSPYEDRLTRLEMQGVDISARAIRALLKEGKPIDGLVPGEVAEYIQKKGLYR